MSGPLENHTLWELDSWAANWVDEHGVLWKVTKDIGWSTGTAPRTGRTPRAGSDGVHPSRSTRDPRVIVLEGKAEAPNAVERDRAIDRITGLFADGRGQVLTVTERHMTRHAYVELDGEISTDALTTRVFEWTLRLLAPDPLKYGPERIYGPIGLPSRGTAPGLQEPLTEPLEDGWDPATGGGQVFLPNPGNKPLWARLRIDGQVPNPRLWVPETGSSLRLALNVPVGQHLDLLLKDRRVFANGTASRRQFVSYTGDWLAIPPGGATLQWDADLYDESARLWAWAPDGAWS